MAITLKLGDITPGEHLWLARKRTGENHERAAARMKVSPDTYLSWEHDKFVRKIPDLSKLPAMVPYDHEACVLARRRWNADIKAKRRRGAIISQKALALHLGVSRLWICKMECGKVDCTRLTEFWGAMQ